MQFKTIVASCLLIVAGEVVGGCQSTNLATEVSNADSIYTLTTDGITAAGAVGAIKPAQLLAIEPYEEAAYAALQKLQADQSAGTSVQQADFDAFIAAIGTYSAQYKAAKLATTQAVR